jgi:hypothetical protein
MGRAGADRKKKTLYRGAFNYAHNVEILYRYAYTERQAWYRMCDDLARKHGVCTQVVTGLFDGTHDNYRIEVTETRNEKTPAA